MSSLNLFSTSFFHRFPLLKFLILPSFITLLLTLTLTLPAAGQPSSPDISKDSPDYTSVGATNMHTFTRLSPETEYTIKNKASNASGSAESAAITGLAAPTVPEGLRPTAKTAATIVIVWTQEPDVTYEVSQNNGTSYTSVGETDTYTFMGLNSGDEYTIKIKASNMDGSAESAAITVRTIPPPARPVL